MGLWSRMLDMVLGGQSEAGNRSYVFVLPTLKSSRVTLRTGSLGRRATGDSDVSGDCQPLPS